MTAALHELVRLGDDDVDLDDRLELVATMPRRYGAYRTVLDPREIRLKRFTQWPGYLKWWPSAVCWGDWDAAPPGSGPFREELIAEYLREDLPYRQTARYRQMVADLTRHGVTLWPGKGCRSVGEIDQYLLGIRHLYDRIRSEGYQARPDGEAGAEITVRVDRDGAFTKCGQGTHRFAIARMLGLRLVPVVVDLMHWRWARNCMQRRGAGLSESVRAELAGIAQARQQGVPRDAERGPS